MSSGGARARSGPPPDPMALRRQRPGDAEWTTLPAEGRAGDPPMWPLAGESEREVKLWQALWAMPQAVIWEAMRQDLEVALYVRDLALFEQPGAPVNLGTLVRQQADALGLTIPGLRTNRWKIGLAEPKPDATAPPTPKRRRASSAQPSARERFRIVRDDEAG